MATTTTQSAIDTVVESLFDVAEELRKEKENVYERIQANRRVLRDFDTQGMLSDEASEKLAEVYPVKQIGSRNGDES